MYGNTYTTSGYTTNGNANPNRAGMMQQRYIQQTQPGGYPMTAQQRIYRTQPGATNPQMMSQQFKLNAYQMQYMQQQKADPMGFQTKKPNVTSGSFNAQPQEMHVLQMAQQMQAMQANRGVNMMQQPVYPYNRTAQQPSMKPSYMQPQMAQMQRVTPPPPRKEEPEKREPRILPPNEAPFLTNRQIFDEMTGSVIYRPARFVEVASAMKESKVGAKMCDNA